MSSHPAVNKLIEYLRIKSVHPTPDYDSAIKFLKAYSEEIGFDSYKEVTVHPGRVVVIMTYLGLSPDKPSILLNSHTDVVPADYSRWKCDPFEGKRYENGYIYGRGVQDMKSVGIQHLEVIRKLKQNNIRPERTIHLTFVPDEEIGGMTGMNKFIKTQEFKDLNIGLAMDEGVASETDEFCIYYSERLVWWLTVKLTGNTGHGSRFIEKTAVEKLQRLINCTLAFREEQKKLLESQCSCRKLGDVTSLNLTQIHGGVQPNVVPSEFVVTFDIRVTPRMDIKDFEKILQSWIAEAEGEDGDSGKVEYSFWEHKRDEFASTSIDEEKNKWWKSLKATLIDSGYKFSTEIFSGATDSRYIRELGIPAFGFSPMINTPVLMHDHNEYLNEKVFLDGIDLLYKMVLNLAQVKD